MFPPPHYRVFGCLETPVLLRFVAIRRELSRIVALPKTVAICRVPLRSVANRLPRQIFFRNVVPTLLSHSLGI